MSIPYFTKFEFFLSEAHNSFYCGCCLLLTVVSLK
nr:MAG TPA: activated protein kinase C receptor [Caudoviricetes sp.]